MAALCLLAADPAFATQFTFDFEDSSAPLIFNGSAQITFESALVISGQASGQLTGISVSPTGTAGSIVLANPIDTSFFDVTFSFRLFGGEATGLGSTADGITLTIFGGDTSEAVGLCCSGIGFAEIVGSNVPAFSIEFDTYDNGQIDICHDSSGNVVPCPPDSPAPHIAINLGSLGIFGALRDQSLVPAPNLRNELHTAQIVFSNNLLNVGLDGNPIISDFPVPQEYVPAPGFIGLTGSTGSYSDYQIVDNLTITANPEPASLLLVVSGLGLGALRFFKRNGRRG